MREIKFRAWDKKNKKWIGTFDLIDIYELGIDGKWELYRIDDFDDVEFVQCTGLKDRKGVEIYEGDIVGGYPHGTVFVRWCNEYACFESVSYEDVDNGETVERKEVTHLFANDFKDCNDAWEVIGNIYESPELLKDVQPTDWGGNE